MKHPTTAPAWRFVKGRAARRGFVMSYVLLSLAILSLTIAAVSRMNARREIGDQMVSIRDEVVEQASMIRSKIFECIVTYPGGGPVDHSVVPKTPVSSLVVDVTCPGAPDGMESIWPQTDGIFKPKPVAGLGPWSYINDATSARISIAPTTLGGSAAAALYNSAARLGPQSTYDVGVLTLVITKH